MFRSDFAKLYFTTHMIETRQFWDQKGPGRLYILSIGSTLFDSIWCKWTTIYKTPLSAETQEVKNTQSRKISNGQSALTVQEQGSLPFHHSEASDQGTLGQTPHQLWSTPDASASSWEWGGSGVTRTSALTALLSDTLHPTASTSTNTALMLVRFTISEIASTWPCTQLC